MYMYMYSVCVFCQPLLVCIFLSRQHLLVLSLLLVKLADEGLKVEVDLPGCLLLELLLEDPSLNLLQLHLTSWTHALDTLTRQLPLLEKYKHTHM